MSRWKRWLAVGAFVLAGAGGCSHDSGNVKADISAVPPPVEVQPQPPEPRLPPPLPSMPVPNEGSGTTPCPKPESAP